jgi:hypothetical protein
VGKAHRQIRRGGVYIFAGGTMMLTSWGVLAFQIGSWPADGKWMALPIRLLWEALGGPEPSFRSEALQKAALATLEFPVGGTIAVLGILVLWWGVSLQERGREALRGEP